MRRTPLALVLAVLTAAALAVPTGGASVADDAPAPRVAAAEPAGRGSPGQWTRISTGAGSTITSSSLFRTPDRVLHVVYPRPDSGDDQLGHAAVSAGGTTVRQNDVLGAPWSIVEDTPALVAGPSGGLRVVFGGQQTTTSGFWSNGRMYTLTAPASGASWTLPPESVGQSGSAFASYGTAATTLADGTPVAAYAANSAIRWHVGTGTDPDQSFEVAGCCVYDLAMVRSGSEVHLAWYGNGSSSATNGTFVRRIHPTVGPVSKVPGSSVGSDSRPTGRVALAARTGGGVHVAYCSGYPICNGVRLWRVGSSSSTIVPVPSSRGAKAIGLAPAPGGRLWVSWSDGAVKAVRTNVAATRLGAVRDLRLPPGRDNVYQLSLEGSTGRGDVVVNTGDGFWHTQALAGLWLSPSSTTWRRGTTRTVRFTVTDAGSRVPGARVAVGARACGTDSAGQCSLTFPSSTRAGYLTATATKTSYGSASRSLRVT